MRGDSREIAGRLGGVNFLLCGPFFVVGTTMEAALALGRPDEDDSGGGTDDSGAEAEETVKALSDMVPVNGLGGSCRKTSIPYQVLVQATWSVLFGRNWQYPRFRQNPNKMLRLTYRILTLKVATKVLLQYSEKIHFWRSSPSVWRKLRSKDKKEGGAKERELRHHSPSAMRNAPHYPIVTVTRLAHEAYISFSFCSDSYDDVKSRRSRCYSPDSYRASGRIDSEKPYRRLRPRS